MQRVARNFLHKSISFHLRSRTSISPSLLEPLVNPNFSCSNLHGVSNRNFYTTASHGEDQSDKIAERIDDLISRTASCESILKGRLEGAASYLLGYPKHCEFLRGEVEWCRSYFDYILESMEELREKLSAEDKMVLQKWLRCLEIRFLPMEDRIKTLEHEVCTQQIGGIVLGFVLRIHKHQSMVKEGTAWFSDWLDDPLEACKDSVDVSSLSNCFFKHLMGKLLEKDEMLLRRWIELQVQLLKDEFWDLELHQRCNFMDNRQETKEEDEDDKEKIDKAILNTILKIAYAREKLNKALHAEFDSVYIDEYTSFVQNTIKVASDSYENLLLKLPENYDVTLKQWIELTVQPRLQELFKVEIDENGVPTST